jgi:hypothetical protein
MDYLQKYETESKTTGPEGTLIIDPSWGWVFKGAGLIALALHFLVEG